MIKGLHHNAYRCRDAEETRTFYEDFLGLPLSHTIEIEQTKSGRKTEALHTFYRLGDGSYLAFFEAPDMAFEFKVQHDFDLHIALEVEPAVLERMFAEGRQRGIETRGISDHDFLHSIYFRDPNGYVIELTAKLPNHDQAMDPASNCARAKLDRWQAGKKHRAPTTARDALDRSRIVRSNPVGKAGTWGESSQDDEGMATNGPNKGFPADAR